MAQIIGAIIAIVLLATAFKIALILLVVAGLIFRTKETVGLLAIGWIIVGFSAHPLIGIGIVALLLSISLCFKHKEKKEVTARLLLEDRSET